jgi:hypothetical protein
MSSPDSWEGDHNAQHNMEIKINLMKETLETLGRTISAWSRFRNELNGLRHRSGKAVCNGIGTWQ